MHRDATRQVRVSREPGTNDLMFRAADPARDRAVCSHPLCDGTIRARKLRWREIGVRKARNCLLRDHESDESSRMRKLGFRVGYRNVRSVIRLVGPRDAPFRRAFELLRHMLLSRHFHGMETNEKERNCITVRSVSYEDGKSKDLRLFSPTDFR